MNEKIIGYILLFLGLLIMAGSALGVYQVFTHSSQPPQLFKFESISIDLGQLSDQQTAPITTDLISGNMLSDIANVSAYLFLMGFVASIGQKVSSIGVNLVRTIQVSVNTKETKTV